ncbi:hypothetical protein ID866_6981, partial [Astraeus odoratus]
MATTFAPSASFNPGIRPPSRADRNGGSGASKNYVLPVPSGFSIRVFKAPPLSRQYVNHQPPVTKSDVDYRPSQARQSATGGRDSHRKLTKAPPQQGPEDYHGRGGRLGTIHTGPVPDTYIYERPVASHPDPYYYPASDCTSSDMDSIFSATHSSSSSSSMDSPRRAALQLALLPHERLPSYSHGQRNHGPATTYSGSHHACPTCSEMSTNVASFPTSRVDAPSQGSRPLPTPPVGARVRKDSLQLTSERSPSISSNHSRPRLPPLRIDDPPSYPIYVHGAYHGQWQPDGEISALPPQLTRSGSQKSIASSGSGSYGPIPPPPGLLAPNWDHIPTSAPGSDADGEISTRPQRRNSDGDKTRIHPPRRVRSQTAPVPRQRRKGWFNRRGDQLWRNDGSYKPPPPGEAYPPD